MSIPSQYYNTIIQLYIFINIYLASCLLERFCYSSLSFTTLQVSHIEESLLGLLLVSPDFLDFGAPH